MRVDIKTIVRNIGASIEIKTESDPDLLSLSKEGIEFTQPVKFEGTVTNMDRDIMVLQGMASTYIKSGCNRCLKDVEMHVQAKIDATFKSVHFKDSDLSEESDPEEEYSYEGYSIELDKVLFDSLILSLPTKILCSENCKGICEWCGNDLNEKDCNCKELHENESSLFEKLRNLL